MYLGYAELSTSQSVVKWNGADGKKKEIMVDAALSNIGYYNEHQVSPFVMTEEEYQAVMAYLTSTE